MGYTIDLTPAVLDLNLYAGDDGSFQIIFVDIDNNTIDVSIFTWEAQIRNTRASSDHISLTVDVSEANVGILTIDIPESVTRSLANNLWNKTSQWDLQSTDGTSPVVTILQGSVYCGLDVTR
jgi:hypothetical protein